MRNICNMHTHFPKTVIGLSDRQGIVEILGIGWIHSKGRNITKIPSRGIILHRNCAIYRVGGSLNLFFKLIRQVVLRQYGVHLGIVIAHRA